MKVVENFLRLYRRFHYPVSLPEEVAYAIGIEASSALNFDQFILLLSTSKCCPKKLSKFMSRESAEAAFDTALRKEKFQHHSLFSYYFCNGWMGFSLQFDTSGRLRRIYVHHKKLTHEEGIELALS
jgi:hypothetical protein